MARRRDRRMDGFRDEIRDWSLERYASGIPIESSKRTLTCSVHTIKVPNFFCAPEYRDTDFAMNSPSFQFEGVTWRFRCYDSDPSVEEFVRDSDYENSSKDAFNLDIVFSEIPEQSFFYKIALFDTRVECGSIRYLDFSVRCRDGKDSIRLCRFENDGTSYGECDTLTITVHLFTFEAMEVKQARRDSPHKKTSAKKKLGDCKIKSTEKIISSEFHCLKLPNLFTTPWRNDNYFDKKSSELAEATYCFHYRSRNAREFSLGIEVLNTEKPLRNCFIDYTLIDSKDEILSTESEVLDFKETSEYLLFGRNKNFESSFCSLHIHVLWEEALTDPAHISRPRDFDLLSRDFRKLFLDGRNSDLTLKVDGEEFKVHRSILMARSLVLDVMLSYDTIEKNKGVIEIPDVDPNAMELVLTYVYCGEVDPLNWDNALGVYHAADKFSIAFLKKESAEFMKRSLTTSVICDVIRLALSHEDQDLLECSKEYFASHVSDILPTVGWMDFMKSNTIVANELFIQANKRWESKM